MTLIAPVPLDAPVAAQPLKHAYTRLYSNVRNHLGHRRPGRNVLEHGVKTRKGVRAATNRELARSVRVFRRWLHPQTTVPVAVASIAQPVTTGLPACAAESGTNYSTGPANTNPSTGATGRWQEMPMHRQRGGLCYGIALSPAGQDRCAVLIFKAQGSGAWVGCSG